MYNIDDIDLTMEKQVNIARFWHVTEKSRTVWLMIKEGIIVWISLRDIGSYHRICADAELPLFVYVPQNGSYAHMG